ncbi:hypothetical protein [Embleya hyalina]|uniref:TonB-dependent receptor n=1 Tax=Embleya hyalina TaxID=516124 RepID=A0A401YF27_9ACTN|nr:hypothetical protein [Embleya hyalina]GCD93189.1 hypothetical protein EHYA_00832 [Embleya hyalina]
MRALNTLTVTTLAAGLLFAASPGVSAAADTGGQPAPTPEAASTPVVQLAPTVTVLPVGSFKPDSVLEIDRSLNAATGGVVGSDLEGGD